MPRLTNRENQLKLKAVWNAFEYLKLESITNNKNLAIPRKICDLANSYDFVKEFEKKLSLQSIKQPSSIEFKKLKKQIDDFRDKYKTIKNSTTYQTKNKIEELNTKVQVLTYQLAELLSNEIDLKEQLFEAKEALLRSNKERDIYYNKICELNEN